MNRKVVVAVVIIAFVATGVLMRARSGAAADRQAEAAQRYARAAAVEASARRFAESTSNAVLRGVAERVHEETQARAGSAMMDSFMANVDAATHVLATFTNKSDAEAVSAALRDGKVWAMMQFGMAKDAPQVFRLQIMPKDFPKLTEELRAKLQAYKPSEGYHFPEAK